ncbi:SusC/RagA family TonB-linked outer membrane protein [Chitinophaga horti]|uniref:SusC/RagA family TonB-linked outer membrane protein n=1 Tax=Chitinophaga horti TaxID=2920382 RepID=A0ABY6IV33_9BACT|nr:SusC/RagA family TonB-linked outer membrane protein [Chitinophaga horti]UYQ91150.1 SusC/RagA family TonB-linked outer membrane protein [Chitinophaga horti]
MQVKLITLLLTVFICHVSAKTFSQTVTISGNHLKLENLLAAIEQQTGYTALYNEADLRNAAPVSVSVRDLPLKSFLDVVFTDQPLDYTIRRTTIFIRKKPSLPEKNDMTDAAALPPVKGRVTDSTGNVLPGVSITIMRGNSPIGVALTDVRGEFTIAVEVAKGDRLYFSSVGFESQMLTLDNTGASLNVVMKNAVKALAAFEVKTVNTGYQRIRPEQSTGAVSQISTKEYESRISTNFLDGLVNRLPGLMINNDVPFTVGTNSRPLFNIRGISTMSANQSPLIVIDGYPTELTMDMIDPNEIKSVTILKDAAAATVYGVRASNGVIVIERKQASLGKPKFAFRATAGFTPKENFQRYRWADDASAIVANYGKTVAERTVNATSWGQLFTNTGGSITRTAPYYILAQQAASIITPEQAASAFTDLENYDNIDDYSRLFLRPAVTQTYNLNVSGGTANALYYITANYTGNREPAINNDNNRLLFSARSNLKLSQRLSLELTTDYQERNINGAPELNITGIAPYERFQDVNGKPNYIVGSGISPYYNNVLIATGLYNHLYYPLTEVNEVSDKTRTINNRITANFNYNFGGGFDLAFGGIYETSRSDLRNLASENSSAARRLINSYAALNTDGTIKFNVPRGGYLTQQAATTTSITARAQLNYNKRFAGHHSINGILGAEVRNLVNKSNQSSYFGYNDETLLHQPIDFSGINNGAIRGTYGLSAPLQGMFTNWFDQQFTEDRFISGYANIVYAFKNTYSLTGSIRVDQSNLFGTNPKYKYKPLWSAGAAWNLHQEPFIQDIVWIRQLKLRTAYGFNGNVAKMSLPQVIAQAVMNNQTSPASPSLRMLSYANSSLRWEQTKNFNVGLDYELFKHVSGSLDYYRKHSSDLLGNSLIDPTIGVSPTLINKATINNNGVELALHADWISTKKLNWNTGLVMARNTSKVLEVYQRGDFGAHTISSIGYVKDYPVGALFGYRWGGLDTAGYPLVVSPKGTVYRTNVNTINNATAAAMASDTSGLTRHLGSSIPTINAGLSNRVDFGNFYVFCMINYYGGFKVRVPRANPSASRPLEGAGDYWKMKGDENNTDVMALIAYTSANSNNAYNFADKYVVNGDYITLADLTLSYSLDNAAFVKRAGFSHVELKAQASNIWTVGLNSYNYSRATGSFQKTYVTPSFTFAIFTNF